MTEVSIEIKNHQDRFVVGDEVSGTVDLTLPTDVPLSNVVTVSFHCLGEVKWVESPSSLYYLNGYLYYDQIDFHHEMAKWTEAGKWGHFLLSVMNFCIEI